MGSVPVGLDCKLHAAYVGFASCRLNKVLASATRLVVAGRKVGVSTQVMARMLLVCPGFGGAKSGKQMKPESSPVSLGWVGWRMYLYVCVGG